MRNSADEIRPQIQRLLSLVESVDERLARLEASHNRHGQHLARQNDQVARVEEIQAKVNELLSRQSELLARLEEAHVRHAEQLSHLEETYSRQVKQLTRLEEEQCRQGKQLTSVEEGQSRLAARVAQAAESRARSTNGSRSTGAGHETVQQRLGRMATSRLAARRQARQIANVGAATPDARGHTSNGASEAGSLARRESRRESRRATRRDGSEQTERSLLQQEAHDLDQVQGEVRQLGDRLNRLLARLDKINRPAVR